MTKVLDQVSAERGLPKVIRTDNGPEFAGRVRQTWAAHNRVELRFMQALRVSPDVIDRCQKHMLPGSREAWRLLGERLEAILVADNVVPIPRAA